MSRHYSLSGYPDKPDWISEWVHSAPLMRDRARQTKQHAEASWHDLLAQAQALTDRARAVMGSSGYMTCLEVKRSRRPACFQWRWEFAGRTMHWEDTLKDALLGDAHRLLLRQIGLEMTELLATQAVVRQVVRSADQVLAQC